MVKRRTAGSSLLCPSAVSILTQTLQMMIREQDQTMDSIQGTLSTIAQQANLMGQEIVEHNE
jgi:hypothetical protein